MILQTDGPLFNCENQKRVYLFITILISIVWICGMSSPAFSHYLPTGSFAGAPSFTNKPLIVPAWQNPQTGEGDILIDNFEYWDSPCNHGWVQSEPSYPVYGIGVGFVTSFKTILDPQQGSRVLDVYRSSSIFLLGQPYEKQQIQYTLRTPPVPGGKNFSAGSIDLGVHPVVSLKFRAPLGFDRWDIFEFDLLCRSTKGYPVYITVKPIEPGYADKCAPGLLSPRVTSLTGSPLQHSLSVEVDIGRNYMDGSWHVLWINLPAMVRSAVADFEGIGAQERASWSVDKAERIALCGQVFRVDEIAFRQEDYSKYARKIQVDVFELGPVFAQIFEPTRYLLMSDYRVDDRISNVNDFLLDQNNFITDPNRIRAAWVADLFALDPNYRQIDCNSPLYDPLYTKRWVPGDPHFGMPDPVASLYLRDGFYIDSTLPLFADPNLRIAGNRVTALRMHGTLGWNAAIGGYGENAVQSFLVEHLPIDPYDGMPTYIMNRLSALEAIDAYGKAHYGPRFVRMLEGALWNSGVDLWPHIAYIDFTPVCFEDLLVAIEVSDWSKVEKLVFPLSVVNYPVENYPPVVQARIFPRYFKVGEEDECILLSMDLDCFIFSLSQREGGIPSSTHLPLLPGNTIRMDQDRLFYKIEIEGEDSYHYQFGPWIDCAFDPFSGLSTFTPHFEGAFRMVVTCTDDYGASSIARRIIYTINPGTWLNHAPLITSLPSPRVIKAGEEIILNARAVDPDGDQVYASCNIGSIGQLSNGDAIWTFQTNFPGVYEVEFSFFDIRGGSTSRTTSIEVVPWWSY